MTIGVESLYGGIVFFTGYIVFTWFSIYLLKDNPVLISKALKSTGNINENMIDNFKNVDVITAFNTFQYESHRMEKVLEEEKECYSRAQRRVDHLSLIQKSINFLVIISFLSVVYIHVREIQVSLIVVAIYSLFTFDGFGKNLVGFWEDIHRLSEAILSLKGKSRECYIQNHKDKTQGIIINNLSAGYGKSAVFENISLKAVPGDIVEITGPNRSGKTTLLRTIAGIIPPMKGCISYGTIPKIAYITLQPDTLLFSMVGLRWLMQLFTGYY